MKKELPTAVPFIKKWNQHLKNGVEIYKKDFILKINACNI